MTRDENVISLADRVLGACPGCREPVLFAENFIRVGAYFVHVRCAVGTDLHPVDRDFPRSVPPDRGA